MPVFFNGRLLISPTAASVVDDREMANRNLTVGNVLAIVGKSSGGEPKKALRFGSPLEAEAVLRSGDLLDAVLRSFDPSPETGAPSTVVAVRVDPATRASLNLLDASATPVINLVSTDYGLWTNAIKVKIEAGTSGGKKATVQNGNDYYSQDNIRRNVFTVHYQGTQLSAAVSITGSTMTLYAPTGSAVASIALASYPTVQQLVDRINSTADWTAAVTDANGEKPTVDALDYLTSSDAKTAPLQVTADLQALVDWFNSTGEGFVTATRPPGIGLPPANVGFTYLSGGSDGTATNTDWSDAISVLQTEDVQWVLATSPDPAVHAMVATHCEFMSDQGQKERRGFVGTALGTSDAAAISAAKNINSDRIGLIHLGHYDFDRSGTLKLYAPYITAARVAGAFAGSNPGTPLTRKAIVARGLERKLRNPTDTDPLILGGVLALEDTATGYRVVKSISTWLTNNNYNRVEISTGAAVDHVVRNVRDRLLLLVGAKGGPTILERAKEDTRSTLAELARPEPQGPGVIVGDANNPAFKGIQASLEGDVLRVDFQCSPVIPVNYVLVTVRAVPYSGTASAAVA